MIRRAVVALLLAASALPAQTPQAATLRIRQLDVGQADAALITTPEGRHILIDAGPDFVAVGRALRAERIDTLHLVIASHNHADHIGGMAGVFGATVVKAYLENGLPHPTATYQRTLTAIEREPGLQYLIASERTITVGSVAVRVLPPPLISPTIPPTQNDRSVGVVIEHGTFRALFTGDSERDALSAWIKAGKVPKVTLLKAAHHGASDGSHADWVRATSPAIVLISVGSNTYGHPALQVEQAWRASGAAIYRTDRDGDIEILARRDGTFTVRTTRPPTPR